MTPLTFTHANNGSQVVVTRELVWNIYYAEAHKSTFIVSNAGAIIPVTEPVSVVREKVYGQTAQKDGAQNGT